MSTINDELANIFDDMALLLEKKGDLIFKIQAYRRASEIISNFPYSLDVPVRQWPGLEESPRHRQSHQRQD